MEGTERLTTGGLPRASHCSTRRLSSCRADVYLRDHIYLHRPTVSVHELSRLGLRERFGRAYGPGMNVEIRSGWEWSEVDVARVGKAIALGLLLRLVVLPLLKWITLLLLIPTLLLLVL